MTQLEKIGYLFSEARRSAFIVSFLCFIGTGISLAALTTLDPMLGIVIPILALTVIFIFALLFLILVYRLFQPISEIVKMVDKLYDAVMEEELEIEPKKSDTKAEKKQLEKVTQQVEELTKEISALKEKKQASPAKELDNFWRNLTIKYSFFGAIVCVITYLASYPLNLIFAAAGAFGLTAIAILHAHYKGRLRWPTGDEK